ncbi:hypothetical protein HMI55_004450 [Coelomomyces lativittatus]|nr:hypothetical protein HMI56_007394 [Coelomomyces lativittatus]KAJ1514696.1 hypothetical protein HMI55_004450 [Coelomomyces lativittatus]
MEISETHQVSIEHGLYTVENITTLGNQQSLRISNIHLICNIYSNQFVIAFPYSRSILFSHLPKSLPTLSSRSYPIVYLSSNGWLCYQQPINRFYENEENEAMTLNENENETELPVECKEKTNTMMKGKCLCIFIPTNTLPTDQIKDVNAAVSMNWRKIYPNGDQWINLDQEVHFYGCDGTRGFKKLNTANPAPWMWVNPKGEVWKGYQPASQLQMTQQTDLLNETYRSWREDKLDSSENNNAILRRFPDGTVTAILPKNLIEIYIPTLGSITLQNGNFHLRNEDGSEIHFSKEITYTTPSGFPIIIDEKMSQLKFERCEIDLKSMEVKKTNENSKKNIEDTALNQDSQITSCLNTPLLPFEPRQLFMINRNEGTVFHTHLSLSFFVRCTSRMREPILEIQELKRPSLQFGATHKATRYPTLNDSLRSKIVSIWSPLQSIQYAPCISDKKILTDKDPIQNQMTKKVVKDENNIKVKLESKYSESLVTKTLPITPTTFQSSSQLYPLPLLLSDSVRNEYIALNNPTLQMESPIEAQIQPITPTNSFKEIYTFEGIFKTPTGDQKVISWEKGG